MKSFKGRDRSLYVLLIKNYIIYTLVIVVLMMVIYFGRVLVEKTIIQAPRVNRPLGGIELLERGEYENLTLKSFWAPREALRSWISTAILFTRTGRGRGGLYRKGACFNTGI